MNVLGRVIALIALFICIPFVVLPLLIVGLQLLSSPVFWIILSLVVMSFLVYIIFDKKKKGYLKGIVGYVSLEGVDPSKLSFLRLYPDKITIDDIQSVPIKRVNKATFEILTNRIRNYGVQIKRHTYVLKIHFMDKDENLSCIICRSKVDQVSAHNAYMGMEHKINKQIGYEHPKPNYPDKPYEL